MTSAALCSPAALGAPADRALPSVRERLARRSPDRTRAGAGRALLFVVSLAVLLGSASCHSPTEPVLERDLTGDWLGSAARGPCGQGWGEDWTSVEMSLVQTGTAVSGEVFAPGGRRFSISSTDGVFLTVGGLEGSSTCEAFGFFIADRRYDAAGALVAFSGTIGGRCCGTVAGAFAFRRR